MVKVIQPKTELPPHNQRVSGLIKKHIAASLLPANTPPDITMNVCGTSATLTPVFPPSGTYTNSTLIWNNGSTGSTLNVTSSGTYWWQITGTSVVANGNFSSTSPTGFTSSYTNTTTNTPNGSELYIEGKYAIGANPKSYHTAFSQFGDHTTGSGNMLIVNGASAANVTVWTQNINIVANTNYVFSVWVTSATSSNPAILQFSIDGTPLGTAITPSASLADGTWQYFTTTWNSGGNSGGLPIALVNQNTSTSGNDFAIDDIVFAPVYRQNIIVNLNPIPVLSVTSPAAQCGGTYDLTQAINGWDPTTYTYKDGSGSVLTRPTNITTSGTYTITETNKITGCVSAPQTVTITINPIPVLSVTSPPAQCGGTYDLHSAINSPDATVTYTYSSGASSVSTSGAYIITATKNGCSTSATVNVTINPLPILAVTSPTAQCGGTYDLKSAITNYNNSGAYTYTYKNGATTLGSSVVSASGTYTIVETNNSTNCQSTAPVTVTINPIPVLTVTSPPAQCGGTFDLHSAINGPDATVTYSYSSGGSSVSTSGAYIITATKNGCSTTATVNVTINPIPVLTVTSPPAQCGGTFDLNSAINGPDATVTYSYSSGGSSVSTSGAYIITATKNGCSTTATVNVTIVPLPVLALNGPHTACGAYDLTQTIVGGYDPTTYTYIFKDPSGNVITLANAQAITQSGTYTITEQNKSTGCTSLPQPTTVTISPNPPKPGIL
ncbi:hypothetical protein [Mucilaginibacter sp.]|uniref:hypothetical protein n=1 Tax=Mucilaginibacter sp. TaxID=1882438 RepID=UPI00261D5427|nr:hypothetical protein [Mucilaginibacter sp.]MDB4925868.1 hypothetical protein [Mucilaginibacter sp.]